MKIALIAPPYPLEEIPSPPLGLTYIAAVCEAAGAEVRILDYIVRGVGTCFLLKKVSKIPKVNNIHSLLIQTQHVVFVSGGTNLSQDKNQGLKNWRKNSLKFLSKF